MNFGVNVAIFVLFFAISLVQVIQDHDWISAGLFFVVGLIFLYADKK